MPSKTDGATVSVNKEVRKAQTQRWKRGSYHHHNDDTCAKIAYLCNNGNKGAANKFSADLGHAVTEKQYAI